MSACAPRMMLILANLPLPEEIMSPRWFIDSVPLPDEFLIVRFELLLSLIARSELGIGAIILAWRVPLTVTFLAKEASPETLRFPLVSIETRPAMIERFPWRKGCNCRSLPSVFMVLSARIRLPFIFRFPAIATSESVEGPRAMRP